jgi:hypothetical protein
MRRPPLVVLALAIISCSSGPPIPHVRFANAPAVTVVNDRLHVPRQPKEIEFQRYLHNFDALFHRRVTRALELHRNSRALGINALDEVPSSTWFTNRIGTRDVSIDEIKNRPGAIGSPEAHKPWTIVSSKVGGMTVGFIIKDARGEKFLLKFDPRGYPEVETGTQVIMSNLLWAVGYNVTDDYVVYLKQQDLVLAPDAKIKLGKGKSKPLDQTELERRLAQVEVGKDGTMRGLASHWLPGKPLGGHPAEGVRADDPNDRIPHELRRDLRGAYAVFSWLDHNDLHEANRFDAYVEDPADMRIHYVKHYWIDFGIGLGFAAAKNAEPRYGYEYHLDYGSIVRSLLSLGVWERPWEHRGSKGPRGFALYDVDAYDPGTWRAQTPAYVPIYVADRIDKFWASKIMMKLTPAHIRAAVETARLTDPRAVEWLTHALIERQRKTARYWFKRTSPLDEFAIEHDRLCFKDLMLEYRFAAPSSTRYTMTFYDRTAKQLARRQLAGGLDATCGGMQLSDDHDAYTIVRIETRRANFKRATYVHIARDPHTAVARVIGIWRE